MKGQASCWPRAVCRHHFPVTWSLGALLSMIPHLIECTARPAHCPVTHLPLDLHSPTDTVQGLSMTVSPSAVLIHCLYNYNLGSAGTLRYTLGNFSFRTDVCFLSHISPLKMEICHVSSHSSVCLSVSVSLHLFP